MKKRNRFLALFTALSLLLGLLAGCGGTTATAAVMKLRKTRGKVSVSDDAGKSLEPERNLGLYSGYGVKTTSESYAWIDLDEVKLTKLDEDSAVEITKDGGDLELKLKSGKLFFHITEPLEEDESLNIRTSSMVIGIRGTCGWVTENSVALLEGKVEVTAGGQAAVVTAGEMAVLTAGGELAVTPFPQDPLPTFVWEEIEDDETLREEIEQDSGLSLPWLMPGVVVMLTPVGGDEVAEQLSRPEVTGVIVRLGESGAQNYISLTGLDAPEKFLYVEDLSFSLKDSTLGRLELKKTPGYSDGLADVLRDSTVGSLSLTNCRASLCGCTTGDIQVQGGGSLELEWYNISDRSCIAGNIHFDGSLLSIEHGSVTGDIEMISGELRVDNTCTTGTVTYRNGDRPG